MKLTFTYNNQSFVYADLEKLRGRVPENVLLEEVKKVKIQEVKEKAGKYINSKYPLWKQNNDLSDKEKLATEIIYLFNKQITADDLRIAVANIIANKKTLEDVLIEYGIKVGFIETDTNGLPLLDYTLQDGTTIRANINGEYTDDAGTAQTIDMAQVVSKQVVLNQNVNPQVIEDIKQKATKLIEISKRIIWKDTIREKSNLIEEEIKAIPTIDEVVNYNIVFE